MLDNKKLLDMNQLLLNIVNDIHWLEFHNDKQGHNITVMSLKSLVMQLRAVAETLDLMSIEEEEV